MAFRSILCLALCLGLPAASPATGATGAEATVALKTQGPRTSGRVSVSLQNEVNAAMDRGREWLLARQNADGSWGTNAAPRTHATSLASLALLHDATADQRAAALRGCRWLSRTAVPETSDVLASHAAWRALALRVAAPLDPSLPVVALTAASVGATNRAIVPMHAMLLRELGLSPTHAGAPYVMPPRDLESECLLAMPPPGGMPASAAPTNLLARLADHWPVLMTSCRKSAMQGRTRDAWVFARYINRAGGGTLADAQGNVVDWRNELAQELVSAQSIDPHGRGGCWTTENRPGSSLQRDPVVDTAFALLALDEL